MTLAHPKTTRRAKETLDLADPLVAYLERQLPRLERQPEPLHDAASGTAFAH